MDIKSHGTDFPVATEFPTDKIDFTDIIRNFNQILRKYSESLDNLQHIYRLDRKKLDEDANTKFAEVYSSIWQNIKGKRIKDWYEDSTIENYAYCVKQEGNTMIAFITCILSNGETIKINIDDLNDYEFID